MAEEDQDVKRIEDLQLMIDTFAERLVRLRTQCSTSNELILNEIRTTEGKLIKHFSGQYVSRLKLESRVNSLSPNNSLQNIPSLEQWLQVVGLCNDCVQNICTYVKTLDELFEKPQRKLTSLVDSCRQFEEELRRLSTALRNLKYYIEKCKTNETINEEIEQHLYWDSWDGSVSNLNNQEGLTIRSNGIASTSANQSPFHNAPVSPSTPPIHSPPLTPVHKVRQDDQTQKSPGSVSESSRYGHPHIRGGSHPNVDAYTFKTDGVSDNRANRRARLSTVPNTEHSPPNNSLYSSPSRSPPSMITLDSSPIQNTDLSVLTPTDPSLSRNNTPIAPRSPKTPTSTCGMTQVTAHRFTKHFSMKIPCDYCGKRIFLNTGLKCTDCNYRCHINCERKVPPACHIRIGYVEAFIRNRQITSAENNGIPGVISSTNGVESSPLKNGHLGGNTHPSPVNNGFLSRFLSRGGSDSATSSHSSAPSSPALFTVNNQKLPATDSAILTTKEPRFDFDFPVEVINKEAAQDDVIPSHDTDSSQDTVDQFDRNVSREDPQDGQWDDEKMDRVWPRQYSVSMKEWEIPWNELNVGDILGVGHFGTVYSGNWHGDVAIKLLNMDFLGDETILENFKSEVSIMRKTRHENLVLFMGACMKPPHLAIVTSKVQGKTLYNYIHLRRDKFSMAKTTIIAQQIVQGMGYLHAKNIVHKDLRSKNIFLEKDRAVVSDFGLFSVTKFCFKNRTQDGLIIPPGWLCYLAPEIMRNLRVDMKPEDEDLPFSKAADVYAFGTVWYELLCGEFPFITQDPEAIIWQVGKGMKPSLANLEASRDVKDVLMQCCAYVAERRPNFTELLDTLEKLPKKKLARSPSHPVHIISRSAESMF